MPADTHEAELQRYWWLKRFSAIAAALFVLLTLAWLLWYWYANRHMARLIADLKATGQPVSLNDLQHPPVPEERNGVPLLRQAVLQMSAAYPPTSSGSLTFRDELPYPPAWHEMMEKCFQGNAPLYPLIRKARLHGDADWQFKSPTAMGLLNAGFGVLASQRALANILGDTALYHHFKGNDQEALETILDCQYLARATAACQLPAPALIATGIDALASQRLQVIAADLHIPSGPSGDATRAQVRQMIADMSGDAPDPRWFATAHADLAVVAIEDAGNPHGQFVLRPLQILQSAESVQRFRADARCLAAPNLPAAKAMLPAVSRSQVPAITPWSLNNQSIFPKCVYTGMATRRIAAVSLAVALYRNDCGRYPAKLDDLVPAYLAAIPLDPMSATARPFGYMLAVNGTRPVLISAGEDGTTQISSEALLPSQACYGWRNTASAKCDDQYFDLSPWKDPAPPAEPQ